MKLLILLVVISLSNIGQGSPVNPLTHDVQLTLVTPPTKNHPAFWGHLDRYNRILPRLPRADYQQNVSRDWQNAMNGYRAYMVWKLLRDRYLVMLNFGVCTSNTHFSKGCFPRRLYEVPKSVKAMFSEMEIEKQNPLINDLIVRLETAEIAHHPGTFVELFRNFIRPVQALIELELKTELLQSFTEHDQPYFAAFKKDLESKGFKPPERPQPFNPMSASSMLYSSAQTGALGIYQSRKAKFQKEVAVAELLDSYEMMKTMILRQFPDLGSEINAIDATGKELEDIPVYQYYYKVLEETAGFPSLKSMKSFLIRRHIDILEQFDQNADFVTKGDDGKRLLDFDILFAQFSLKKYKMFDELLESSLKKDSKLIKILNSQIKVFAQNEETPHIRTYGDKFVSIVRELARRNLEADREILESITKFRSFNVADENLFSLKEGEKFLITLSQLAPDSWTEAREFYDGFKLPINWESTYPLAKKKFEALYSQTVAIEEAGKDWAPEIIFGVATMGISSAVAGSRMAASLLYRTWSGSSKLRALFRKSYFGYLPGWVEKIASKVSGTSLTFGAGSLIAVSPLYKKWRESSRMADFWNLAYEAKLRAVSKEELKEAIQIKRDDFSTFLTAAAISGAPTYALLFGKLLLRPVGNLLNGWFTGARTLTVQRSALAPVLYHARKKVAYWARSTDADLNMIKKRTSEFIDSSKMIKSVTHLSHQVHAASKRLLQAASPGKIDFSDEIALQQTLKQHWGKQVLKNYQENPKLRPILTSMLQGNVKAADFMRKQRDIWVRQSSAVYNRVAKTLGLKATLKAFRERRTWAAGINEVIISVTADFEARGKEDFLEELDYVILNAIVGFAIVGRLTGESLRADIFDTRIPLKSRIKQLNHISQDSLIITGSYSLIASGLVELWRPLRSYISGAPERYDDDSFLDRLPNHLLIAGSYAVWGAYSTIWRQQIFYHGIVKRLGGKLFKNGYFGPVGQEIRKMNSNQLGSYLQRMEGSAVLKNTQAEKGFITTANYFDFFNNQFGTRVLTGLFKSTGIQENLFKETGDLLLFANPITELVMSNKAEVYVDNFCANEYWGLEVETCF